ncbi:MAG: hypothetical protein GXO92_01095, partial [FCB group bacterium]|nr:hypothetical protein [FCB group bacterium]
GWGIDIEFSPSNPSRVWFSDTDHIYYSNDTGRTWAEQLDGIKGNIRDIEFSTDRCGWMLTDRSVYRTTNAGELSIKNEDDNILPERFELYQNIPNPFNPTTILVTDYLSQAIWS